MTDDEMFECLKQWRMKVAEKKNKKAFEILSNAVLMAIVKAKPTRILDLRKVKGMGPSKTGQYGHTIVNFIAKVEGTPPEQSERKPDPELNSSSLILIEKLTAFRRKNSGTHTPAYMIYTDEVMKAIIKTMPATLQELYEIKGVRRDFVKRHGEEVLAILKGD